ncbi:MAG: HNH endonuclease [Negativicutes bacterium]|nr:HNH endonuclease [Negativicutes bacterium]
MSVAEHIQKHTLKEVEITPDHGDRDMTTFNRSVQFLKDRKLYKCIVSGKTENLQVHHIVEFSLAHCVDFVKLKAFLMWFDPLGLSKEMADQPITSIDDPRNLVPLDQQFHTGVDAEDDGSGIGIHEVTFSVWVLQLVCKDGCNPIPQKGETLEQAQARIAKNTGQEAAA